jgi:negative regulator of flagellin synthesis FlgM
MVIDPNNRLTNVSSNTARSRSASGLNQDSAGKADNAKEKPTASDGDSVLLSQEAQALKRLEAHINSSPDIDGARVAAIKRAIAEGKFEINVERIAEKMLQQDSLF